MNSPSISSNDYNCTSHVSKSANDNLKNVDIIPLLFQMQNTIISLKDEINTMKTTNTPTNNSNFSKKGISLLEFTSNLNINYDCFEFLKTHTLNQYFTHTFQRHIDKDSEHIFIFKKKTLYSWNDNLWSPINNKEFKKFILNIHKKILNVFYEWSKSKINNLKKDQSNHNEYFSILTKIISYCNNNEINANTKSLYNKCINIFNNSN
jgi:hypothetical protein